MSDSGLDADEQEIVHNNLEQVANQTKKSKPNTWIVFSQLKGAVDFIADGATVATAAPQLIKWGQQAITWAGQLFK